MQDTQCQTSITVVCDNNPYRQGLRTGWGFSALVTGADKTILFDTGPEGSLLSNMAELGIEPDGIDAVVLSHVHRDHTGGLLDFIGKNRDVTVYLPSCFPKSFKDNVQAHAAKVVEVEQSLKICENVYSTGQLGTWLKEQALVVQTDKGLIVMVGCAHAGIIRIVNTAKELLKDNVLLVMGGFHLEWATKGKIEKIISAFRQLQVRYVGLGHCAGDKARSLFEKNFGKNYISIGAGKTLTTADLQ